MWFRELFLDFNCKFWVNQILFIFVHQKTLKAAIKIGFSVHNNYLGVEEKKSKWIKCS